MIWNENNVDNICFYLRNSPNSKYNTTVKLEGFLVVINWDKSSIARALNNRLWIPFDIYFYSTYFRLKKLFL